MLKILIVDDERLARERLISLVDELRTDCEILEAENGLAALEMIDRLRPDIVLLDIRMPVMDGLEVAHHLTNLESAPAVIFTTAYQDHALEAFDTHAVDYLLKPVNKDRLMQAIERASILQRGNLQEIRAHEKSLHRRTHLSARVQGNLKLLTVREIRYLRADQKYVVAGWPGGELLIDESLIALESEFQDQFIRIHRNALIALDYVDTLKKNNDGTFIITLHGVPAALQVSRRNISNLRKALKLSN